MQYVIDAYFRRNNIPQRFISPYADELYTCGGSCAFGSHRSTDNFCAMAQKLSVERHAGADYKIRKGKSHDFPFLETLKI